MKKRIIILISLLLLVLLVSGVVFLFLRKNKQLPQSEALISEQNTDSTEPTPQEVSEEPPSSQAPSDEDFGFVSDIDPDGDTLPSELEKKYGFDPQVADFGVGEDGDDDGLSNSDESKIGTDPNNKDTDGDTYNDYIEVVLGKDHFAADTQDGTSDAALADDDHDGLNNSEEMIWNSDPKNSDTDGDGYSDGEEVDNGYSPTGAGKLE